MRRLVLLAGGASAAVLVLGLALSTEFESEAQQLAYMETNVAPAALPVVVLDESRTGSALATAAFGLSALQPETYNGEVVLDIIEASPLDHGEKDRLTAKLMAAEAGQDALPDVLEDIRISLAVE